MRITDTDTHKQKMQRAIVGRTSRLTVSQIQTVVLEISRQADGTTPRDVFEQNFNWAFEFLTKAERKLDKLHGINLHESE